LLASGLSVSGTAVVSAGAPSSSHLPAPSSVNVVGLKYGAYGDNVRALQNALNRVGIGVKYGVDGYFGSATRASVKAFQNYKGLAVTGEVDSATAAALGFSLGSTQATAVAAATSATSAATSATSTAVGLQIGARGPAVVALQRAIISMGWTIAGGADGVFGAATRAALIRAQKANGVPGTGVVNEATARLFNLTSTPNTATTAQPAAGGSTAAGYPSYDERGARTIALQQALIAAGIALRGGADGVFGASTASGIVSFQRARGLPVTGKVDAATAAALGLSPMDPPPAPPAVNVTLEAKPVQGPCYYGDTWTAARGNGRVHLGTDIAAKEGNELYAVATGTVTKIYTPATDSLAGNGLRITRPDGTYFFYAHLSALAAGIGVGTPVTAGQVVGYVGKTGNAGLPHLHLEVHPGGGSAVNPYPYVKEFGAC